MSDAGDSRVVLTFDPIFRDTVETEYRLLIYNLYDLQGSKFIGNNSLVFTVIPEQNNFPYLMAAFPAGALTTVTLVFSDDMNSTELAAKGNYIITTDPISGLPAPDQIIINAADPDVSLRNVAHLQISPSTPIGALGKIYRVEARNLHSDDGLPIDTTNNAATLNFSLPNLRHVFVYPNPYKAGILVDGQECVVFSNLTEDVEIHILNLQGMLIRTLRAQGNISGGLRWYLDNEQGEEVGSGVYIYYASGSGSNFWGKLAVVR